MKHTSAIPDRVGTYVRSVTHRASGRVAVKSRSTRSGALVTSGSCWVVKTFLRSLDTPWIRTIQVPRRSCLQ